MERITSAALVPRVWKTLILLLYYTRIVEVFECFNLVENNEKHQVMIVDWFTGLLAYSSGLFCHRYPVDV